MITAAHRVNFISTHFYAFPSILRETSATSSLASIITARATRAPDAPAVIEYGPDGRQALWTHGDIHSAACAFARRLLTELNIAPGSRVVISAPNSGRWIAACLGTHLAGMTAVPMDTEYSDDDRANIISFVEPALVICATDIRDKFSSAIPLLELESISNNIEGEYFEPLPLPEGQPFSIVFTSGSTDTPKGVMLSEENFLHNVNMLRTWGKLISPADRLLNLLPLHHVYAFTTTFLLPLSVGCCVVLPASLKPADISLAAQNERITMMAVVPQVITSLHNRVMQEVKAKSLPAQAAFRLMLALGSVGITRGWRPGKWLFGRLHKRFGRLRFFACGGAKLDATIHRTVAALGFRVVEAYGLSETAPILTFNNPLRPVFGSVGKAVPGVELKLADSGGGIKDREVLARGPNVMAGYWRLPEATANSFTDGWFRTGDLGRMDSEGNLFLTGRCKEVLVMPSGKNVYPDELEKIYEQSDLVEEACLCLTTQGGHEHLTAVVVPCRETIRRRRISAINDEIKFELENIGVNLPSYQRVTKIVLTSNPLPRTRLGKLQRFKVLTRLEQELEAKAGSRTEAGGDPADPLLAFAHGQLKLEKVPTGRENLETDLGLDSLNKLDFIAAAEEAFNISLSDEDAASLVTLDDFRQFIQSDQPTGNAAPSTVKIPLEELVDLGSGRFWNAVRWWARIKLRFVLWALFRARVTGIENLPARGAFLLAPNHASYIDGLVMHGMLPGPLSRRLFSVATAEIFDRWPFHQISFRGRIIKTGTLGTSARSLRHAARLLGEGYPVCVFPEGKRSFDGRVDVPRTGLGVLAAQSGAPVVPVYIDGTNALLSRSNPGIHGSRISVHFLPPIEQPESEDAVLERWLTALRKMEEEHERS